MKGTVLRPQWPAPADKNSAARTNAEGRQASQPDTLSRIKLALLDEYSTGSCGSGYDPYNTDAGRRQDLWRRKPKRD